MLHFYKKDGENMEKHELVDINGNKTGKILTHILTLVGKKWKYALET